MAFLVKSGDLRRQESIAVCITEDVPRKNLPDHNCTEFLIKEFTRIMRDSKELFRVEVDIHEDNIFRVYTYAQPLDDNS